MRRLLLAIMLFGFVLPAHAHGRHQHRRHYLGQSHLRHAQIHMPWAHSGRPSAWCGWYELTRHPNAGGRELYLARNWAHVGRPTSPHIGAIVVWAHHVGEIVGGSPGAWLINSGNDGNAVRTRRRSIAGAIAFRDVS
jgi:hypothetical protein